jgi:hypothetical protein
VPLLGWSTRRQVDEGPLAGPQTTSQSILIVWSLVFTLPYLTLIATFDIVESPLVTALLPLFFLGWILWSMRPSR